MSSWQSFRIYEVLAKHFNNPEEAKMAVQEIEQIVEEKISSKKDILLTKDDKIDLIDRIHRAKIETILWIVGIGVLQVVATFLLRKM